MESALIISAAGRSTERIQALLGDAWRCTQASSLAQARERLREDTFGLMIINLPQGAASRSPGGCLDEYLSMLRTGPQALLLLPREDWEQVRARLESRGVLSLPKPLSPVLFTQAVSLLRAAGARASRLQETMAQLRLVERAKGALIGTLRMTESEAHRFIEKQAMDQRRPRRAVAEDIIRTYEL